MPPVHSRLAVKSGADEVRARVSAGQNPFSIVLRLLLKLHILALGVCCSLLSNVVWTWALDTLE